MFDNVKTLRGRSVCHLSQLFGVLMALSFLITILYVNQLNLIIIILFLLKARQLIQNTAIYSLINVYYIYPVNGLFAYSTVYSATCQ